MSLFPKRTEPEKPIKRRGRQVIDPEKSEKKLQFERRKAASSRAAELVKNDPDAERAYVNQILGITIPAPDPDAKVKADIRSEIAREAFEQIKTDPELRKQFAKHQISELIGREVPDDDNNDLPLDGNGYRGSAIEQALDEVDNLEALRERLGGGNGHSKNDNGIKGLLTDPDVVKTFINFMTSMKGGTPLPTSAEPTMLVKVDNKLVQLTQAQYDELVQQNRVQPAAVISTQPPAKQIEPAKTEPVKPIEVIAPKEIPFWLKGMIPTLTKMTDLTPEQFVQELNTSVEGGDFVGIMLLGYLKESSYEKILEAVQPYKDNTEIKPIYDRAVTDEGKTWLQTVIKNVKGKPETVSPGNEVITEEDGEE